MPTNRTPISRTSKTANAPEILALYRAVLADYSSENRVALHMALGRKVWQACVTNGDGHDNEPPAGVLRDSPDRVQEWRNARAIWVRLDAAHRNSP